MNEMTTQNMAAAVGAAVGLVFLVLFMVFFVQIVFGILCRKLAKRKGYKGYFFTGFFLGIIGLLYVIGLPDRYIRKYLHDCAHGAKPSEDVE